jgi:alpha-D-ribose 1-methylphosphonate 5-triphosphate synthase subunit PhnG
MKRKKFREFEEIEMLKKKYLQRIQAQETEIKSTAVEFRDNITGAVLVNKLKDNLFGGSGLAFRLGFMAVTMLRDRLKKRSKRKS